MRKAEEDLRARQQVLRLYGKALDKVASSLPRCLRHMATGLAQASATAIAQHLGFNNTAAIPPASPPSTKPAGPTPRASHPTCLIRQRRSQRRQPAGSRSRRSA